MTNSYFHLHFPEPTFSEQIVYDSFLDSIDGFSQQIASGGSITLGTAKVTLSSGGGAGGEAVLTKKLTYPRLLPTWARKRSFRMRANIVAAVDAAPLISIATGLDVAGSRGFGFRFLPTKIEGFTRNGAPETHTDLLTPIAQPYTKNEIWEAVLTPGQKVDFFISGALVGSITTNIPSGSTAAENICQLVIHADAAALHTMETSEIRVIQE